MFVEKKIESVIKAQLETDLTGVLSDSVTVKTFWAEASYSAGDEVVSYPLVFLACSPNARNEGQTPQRELNLSVVCSTHFNDDYDRNDLQTLYETVRGTIETTAFDFSADINYTANSYSITDGFIDVEENIQTAGFNVALNVCANNFSF